MTSGLRIEQCPDNNAALRRKAALEEIGYSVQVLQGQGGGISLVRSEVSIANNQVTLNDQTLATQVPFLVIGRL